MFGILTGMKITFKHFFGRKVTRLYPYEKRVLPPRMRGLIHYLRDDNGRFKCEGCLLCEKICPPQAITVAHKPRDSHRDRPLTLSQAIWSNFKRSRRSLLSHQGRPELAIDQLQPAATEPSIDWTRISALIQSPGGVVHALSEVEHMIGYLPRHAVTRLAGEAGVDVSSVYSLATGLSTLQTQPAVATPVAVCQCPVCRNAGAAELASSVNAEATVVGKYLPLAAPASRCLGDPCQAPVLRVGTKTYSRVTPDSARQIVREFITLGGLPT